MDWKNLTRDYFSFSRRERTGILTLVGIILLIYLAPLVIPSSKTDGLPGEITLIRKAPPPDSADFTHEINNHQAIVPDYPGKTDGITGTLFHFDPNTLPDRGWEKLGLRSKTIKTIRNYLSKGGRFRKPADLQRIYGLRPQEFERISPFVRIQNEQTLKPTVYTTLREEDRDRPRIPRYQPVDINRADTSALIALPGIGSKLAARIVNFRERLGGFHSIGQFGEIYGLADSSFQALKPYLRLDNPSVRKININTATVEEFKSHPYIRYAIGMAIIQYRNTHGLFRHVDDLKNIMAIPPALFEKIKYYLLVDDAGEQEAKKSRSAERLFC